ncbi:phage terminase large subunit [Streptomyces stelliscabiei]|uniref:phage terminase large subunit n=1 Tax=Streptomyces stelliscabiei TaxID=146820 RepID=UPI0029A815BF|nr:phage terminase large subunit [Streptomyces stelliscabiei]MDX2513850.1 phage terminase large subunit [Streptomyces stelliscabiei]
MTATVVRFEPRGAVKALMGCKDNEVLLSGAAGTGKSVGALMKMHLACLSVPGVRALIARKTHASLTSSTLVTFRQKVAAEALTAGLVSFYGGSAQEPASFRYSNGSVIVVGGLDRSTRLLSTEYDLVFVDEAIEATPEDLDTLVTRLRNGRLSYQQLIMSTNPGPPTHHLKQRADAGRCTMLYSVHEDNPRLYADGEWTEYGQAYLARLDSLTGARYQRMRWGKWVAAEGLVYEGWDESVHVIDRFKISPEWTRWISIDLGFTNPTCIQWWAEDPDGRLYLHRELYRTRTLMEDHAKRMLELMKYPSGQWREPQPRAIICDHDAEDRATLEKHLGLSTAAAKKTVSDGIQAVQSRLKVQADGKPRLFIFRDSLAEVDEDLAARALPTRTVEEITGYIWAVKPGSGGSELKEEPLKKDDHAMDALRYMVAARDLVGRTRVRWL